MKTNQECLVLRLPYSSGGYGCAVVFTLIAVCVDWFLYSTFAPVGSLLSWGVLLRVLVISCFFGLIAWSLRKSSFAEYRRRRGFRLRLENMIDGGNYQKDLPKLYERFALGYGAGRDAAGNLSWKNLQDLEQRLGISIPRIWISHPDVFDCLSRDDFWKGPYPVSTFMNRPRLWMVSFVALPLIGIIAYAASSGQTLVGGILAVIYFLILANCVGPLIATFGKWHLASTPESAEFRLLDKEHGRMMRTDIQEDCFVFVTLVPYKIKVASLTVISEAGTVGLEAVELRNTPWGAAIANAMASRVRA